MIIEFELVKHEKDMTDKRLVRDEYPDNISGQYKHYSEEVEELLRDGYTIERFNVTENPLTLDYKLKLYFAMFAVLKDHEYHASAGYVFAYDKDRAIGMLRKKYGVETRVRSIEELPYEEGTVLYGERWHKF